MFKIYTWVYYYTIKYFTEKTGAVQVKCNLYDNATDFFTIFKNYKIVKTNFSFPIAATPYIMNFFTEITNLTKQLPI
jgi:hypothetical protein